MMPRTTKCFAGPEVKVPAAVILVILNQFVTVIGNPPWIPEPYQNCINTVTPGPIPSAPLIESPDTLSFRALFQPPQTTTTTLSKTTNIPTTAKQPKVSPTDSNDLSARKNFNPNGDIVLNAMETPSKLLLTDLETLWNKIRNNPVLTTDRTIVAHLNKMRETLSQQPNQENINTMVMDLRKYLKQDDVSSGEETVFRNFLPIQITETTTTSTVSVVPTTESTVSTEGLSQKDHLPQPESTATTEINNNKIPENLENIDISPRFNTNPILSIGNQENPENFSKVVRKNFLQTHFNTNDHVLPPGYGMYGLNPPANDLIPAPHADYYNSPIQHFSPPTNPYYPVNQLFNPSYLNPNTYYPDLKNFYKSGHLPGLQPKYYPAKKCS